MTINIEKISKKIIDIDYEAIINKVVKQTLLIEQVPCDIEVNVILVDNEEIRKLNNQYRNKDQVTDVLSFPLIDHEQIGDIQTIINHMPQYFNIESKELVLGDIIVSVEKTIEQAYEYGHSIERELGFLITHSMLHLLGYDHLIESDEDIMNNKQKQILLPLGLIR